MSKNFKKGTNVMIDNNPERVGVVMSVDKIKMVNEDNKKFTTVEYIVKEGEGFNKWASYPKNRLTKIENEDKTENSQYPKWYSTQYTLNGKTITIAAVVELKHEKNNCIKENLDMYYNDNDAYASNADVYINRPIKKKVLSIGYAIKHDDDEYNFAEAESIARYRAIKKPLACMYSTFTGEFGDIDIVSAIMNAKAQFVANNIEKFINE